MPPRTALEPGSLQEAAAAQYRAVKGLLLAVETLKLRDPRKGAVRRGIKEKISQEGDWQAEIGRVSNEWADEMLLKADEAIIYAQSEWRTKGSNEPEPPPISPNAAEVRARLVTAFPKAAMLHGAQVAYVGLAAKTSTAAGQSALEKMGLHKTFAWAHPRSMAADFYQVRGSKVIQAMYDDHIDALRDLIIDATNPSAPKTISEVKASITKQWPGMRAYQVSRIARTETAAIWTSTSMNAYQANGITRWESTLAHGPSIPGSAEYNPMAAIQTEAPCDECSDMAAGGPYSMDDDLPPWHPNCRCEAVPVLEEEDGSPWLPPGEPWTGGGSFDASADNVEMSREQTGDTITENLASAERLAGLQSLRKRLHLHD